MADWLGSVRGALADEFAADRLDPLISTLRSYRLLDADLDLLDVEVSRPAGEGPVMLAGTLAPASEDEEGARDAARELKLRVQLAELDGRLACLGLLEAEASDGDALRAFARRYLSELSDAAIDVVAALDCADPIAFSTLADASAFPLVPGWPDSLAIASLRSGVTLALSVPAETDILFEALGEFLADVPGGDMKLTANVAPPTTWTFPQIESAAMGEDATAGPAGEEEDEDKVPEGGAPAADADGEPAGTPLDLVLALPLTPKVKSGWGLSAQVGSVDLVLPVDQEAAGARIVVSCTAQLGSLELSVSAAYDFSTKLVLARLTEMPSFGELLGAFAGSAGEGSDVLERLDKARIDEAWLLLEASSDAKQRFVAAAMVARAEITLFSELVTFAPEVRLQIEAPPDEDESPLIAGTLLGTVKFGSEVEFTGRLDIPSWRFRVTATVKFSDELLAGFMQDAPALIPPDLKGGEIGFEFLGDPTVGAYSASFSFHGGEADLAKTGWTISDATFGVSRAGPDDGVELEVSAKISIAETEFSIAGGYAEGWFFSGGCDDLRFSDVAGKLFQGETLPKALESIELKDVAITADAGTGSYSIRASTAQPWEPVDDVKLTVDEFRFEKNDKESRLDLVTHLDIDGIVLRLSARKTGGEDGGWSFDGGTVPDEKLDVPELVKKIGRAFRAEAQVPDVLKAFQIHDLHASFSTADSKITFSCSGALEIGGEKVEAKVELVVTSEKAQEPAATGRTGEKTKAQRKIEFKGDLTIAALHIAGRFESGEPSRFVGALKDEIGKDGSRKIPSFSPSHALGTVVPGAAGLLPETEIALDQAIFVHGGDQTLFSLDLAIEARLDLSSLPAVEALVGSASVGLESLGLLASRGTFTKGEIKEINASLEGPEITLPKADGEENADLEPGVLLRSTLALGDEKKPLSLPLYRRKPNAGEVAEKRDAEDARSLESKAADEKSEPEAKEGETPAKPPAPAEAVAAGPTKWFKIDKSLGPLHVGRVGVEYKDRKVGLLLDAGVDIAGLGVDLQGFALRMPIQPNPVPSFELNGLDLSYSGGPIQIAGGFLRIQEEDRYDGVALLKAPNFAITGFGSYTTVNGSASLFIFAALHAELGGPPFFRVRGLAAGFGYNRTLTLPPVDKVHDFPLVRAALEESFISTGGAPAITDAMQKLATYVSPAEGQYWVAAGVKFSSFETVHSVALLSVSFGQEVEIGLLGLSKMSLPKEGLGPEIAHVELAIRASIKPESGVIMIEGRLTDASYIISRDCRLTGGFAFFIWFAGKHEGDFVVTLGGYHPDFQVPSHYPQVPRLGIAWQVTPQLSVSAEMYFALTPSCLMAGGKLAAVYRSGSISAWFIAYADFLFTWQPLHYSADVGIRMGADIDLDVFVVHFEFGVRLQIWGPPFAGRAEIDLSVAQFTIRFGPDRQRPGAIEAGAFRAAFLPEDSSVVALQVGGGLIREQEVAGRDPIRLVNAHALNLTIASVAPVTSFSGLLAGEGARGEVKKRSPGDGFGIVSMGKTSLQAGMVASLSLDGAEVKPKTLKLEEVSSHVPAALWGAAQEEGVVPEPPKKPVTLPAQMGARIGFSAPDPTGTVGPLDPELFAFEPIGCTFPSRREAPDAGGRVADEDLYAALEAAGAALPARAALSTMRSLFEAEDGLALETYFQADPLFCALGARSEGRVHA